MADENDLNININANPSGVEAGSKRAGAAIKGIAGNTKELEAALNKFRASIDPTFAAMQRYNKAHQDNLALLRADVITRKEYNAGMKAAKAAMEAEIATIQRRSAAGRQAAAEERARRQQERAAERAAAQAEAAAARQAAQQKREIERAAREQAKQAAKEEAAAIRAAATAARQAAREKERAERQAAAEARRAASEARRQEKQEAREAARVVREAAREKAREEKQQAREAAAAIRQAKREEREATMAAVREAKQQARQKAAAERQAAREAAQAERQAKAEARQAARDAAAAAKAAAREKAAAERAAAKASREAAAEVERLAKAERAAANAADELRSSIDPAFAAQERYNRAMRTATQLLMQGKLRAGEFTQIMRQQKAQMDINVRSIGRQNAMYVQMGYQAQDVIASLGSGINPLVILAQQGGQTAAALSQMGGRAGQVAAFFAGPWGAAIMGAVMVLGYLWTSMDEGKKKTKDLTDAEDRRIMTLKELTEALRDYIKEQKRSNDTTAQGLIAQRNLNYSDLQAKTRDLTKAEQELADARKRLQDIGPMPMGKAGMDLWAAQIAAATAQVSMAEKKVNDLKGVVGQLSAALRENEIAIASHRSEQTQADKDFEATKQRLIVAYRNETRGITDANVLNQKRLKLEEDLRAAADALAAAKQRESDARRENARAAREEEKATFTSRIDAIGVAGRELKGRGFSVTENNQFGGVTGGHASNSDHAKYAIDVGIPGFGPNNPEASNEAARKKMDEIARAYQARGFRVIWNGKLYQPGPNAPVVDFVPAAGAKGDAWHRSHMDIKAPESIVGQPQGGRLGNELAREIAAAEREAAEEAMRAKLAQFDFEQELNRDNLQEVLRIQDEKIAAVKAFYGEESDEAIDAGRERIRIERSIAREALQIRREQIDQTLQLMLKSYETEKQLAEMNMEERRAVIGFAEQQGVISAQEALVAKAALLDAEFQQQLAHEQRMHSAKQTALRATLEQQNLPAEQARRIQDEIERNEAEHLGRMRTLNAGYIRDVNAMQRDAAAIQMTKWREFASSFTGSLSQAMQGLWMRNMTLQQAFINMADQQVFRLMDMGAKALEQWILDQVKMTGVQQAQEAARAAAAVGGQAAQTTAAATGAATRTGIQAGAAATEQGIQAATAAAAVAKEAIKTGAAVTGAATQTGVAAAAGMGEITTNAAVAAAGAYKSTVVIPFIGPIAAPAAAALALAAVLGFGAMISARGGHGEVSHDGQLAMLHKKETVLPAWIAEPMRQMFVSPRGSGSMIASAHNAGSAARSEVSSSNSSNFYYQPQHHNMGASFDTLLKNDAASLRKWVRNEIRNGRLSVG